MVDLKKIRDDNSLTIPKVKQCFHDICNESQTANKTTAMFLSHDTTQKILAKNAITSHVAELLDTCSCQGNKIYTPAVVSFLAAAASTSADKVFALIIVDVQNDFISGSLAVNEAEMVVPIINEMGSHFQHVYKTADWHPAEHISFFSNVKKGLYPTSDKSEIKAVDSEMFQTVVVSGPPELKQTLWPDHCIQGSQGAEFHPDLAVFANETMVNKGMNNMVDSYSGFWDNGDTAHTPLYSMLLDKGVTDVVVCGIAMDYCVGFTALDAARHGFRTVIMENAVRGVAPPTTEAMVARCKAAGVEFVSSKDIAGMVEEKSNNGVCDRIVRVMGHFMNTAR